MYNIHCMHIYLLYFELCCIFIRLEFCCGCIAIDTQIHLQQSQQNKWMEKQWKRGDWKFECIVQKKSLSLAYVCWHCDKRPRYLRKTIFLKPMRNRNQFIRIRFEHSEAHTFVSYLHSMACIDQIFKSAKIIILFWW